jgi:GAF domain-containing protein
MLLWTVALLVGMELISNNVVEPWLYGASTGISSVAVILAAIFWTTLWGPIGLVLATPLTVCLVVLGRYVPQLQFLDVLLGCEPVLKPEEQFYQRLLAGNTEEAVDLAEAYVEDKSALSFYDEVCLPALRLAETDRHEGDLGIEGRKSVAEGVLAVVRELGSEAKEAKIDGQSREDDKFGPQVLCIGGRGEHDRAAASMLAYLLHERGIAARVLPSSTITPDAIGKLDLSGVEVVVVSYLHPSPQPFARYVCRRLRRSAPGVKLLAACWSLVPEEASLEAMATNVGADAIVSSLGIASKRVEEVASGAIKSAPMAAPIPVDEEARLQALHASGLLEARSGGHLDRIASKLAETFETPIALVTLVDESCQIWKGSAGLPDDLAAAGQAPRETSICGHVVAIEAPLVVENTLRDPRFANNPFLRTHGIRFYAGAPLRTPCGQVIGSLCVIDTKPRSITSREVKLLQMMADELMANTAGERDFAATRPHAA